MSSATYSLVHFCLAGMAFAMMFVHLTLWLAVRGERAQLWVGSCHACFALLFSSAAATSDGSGGVPWLAGIIPATALHSLMLLAIGELYALPATPFRRGLFASVTATSVLVAAERTLAIAGATRNISTSDALLFEGPLAGIAKLIVLLPLVFWIVESARVLRRHTLVALSAIVCCGMTMAVMTAQSLAGETRYLLLGGSPFLVFASATVVAGYVRNARRAERAGEYRLEKSIATGGMGELFLARKIGLEGFSREVALKRIRPDVLGADAAEFEARFLTEAKLAARLSHPNIVAVYDLGKLDEGGWFLAMEFLHGWSLLELRLRLLAANAVAPPEVIAALGEQICRGLAHAHAAGIVHRDVTPQNVMLTRDGIVKLVDFGIAKSADAADLPGRARIPGTPGSGDLTLPGKVMGKVAYLSPEQLDGEPATPQTDMFAAGVLLYELATGTRPYRSPGEPAALPHQPLWTPVRDQQPAFPEALDATLSRALAWSPGDRFESAASLAESLRRLSASLPYADLGAWARTVVSGPANTAIESTRTRAG